MATKKYVWKFDLEEYLMTKDVITVGTTGGGGEDDRSVIE